MRRRSGELGSAWTVLAAAGSPGALAVDGAGRLATGRVGWSLDWEVHAGEQRCTPRGAASCRQRAAGAEGAAPVALETVVRAGDGDVSQLAYVAVAADATAGALGVLEVRNRTSAPVAVTLVLRPGDHWRPDGLWCVEIDAAGVLANGARALWWERPPAAARLLEDVTAPTGPRGSPPVVGGSNGLLQRVRSRRGQAAAELTWSVTHGGTLRVVLPLQAADTVAPEPAVVPTLAQVGRGWDLHTAGGLRVAGLRDGRIETLVTTAIRRLLAIDVGADAGDGPDGRLSPAERALVGTALAVAGFPQRAAEVVPVRAGRNPSGVSRMARREAARVTAPFGAMPEAAEAMAADAGPGGGWVGDRGGDDPALRAAFLLAVRDTLVSEQGGRLDLLAGAGADLAGSRPPIEVHRLATGCGVLSFAVRWHDESPALLWELVPPDSRLESWAAVLAGDGETGLAAPVPLRITASALAAGWCTRELAGEALLRR
ncbi:MAG: hypothetical protein OXG55_12365 [bacterium]|nr:hypothetical protein [bacterium]